MQDSQPQARSGQDAGASDDAWADSSKIYTKQAEDATGGYGKVAVKLLTVQPGERFLDIATGPGALAVHAAEAYDADVDAIDFSNAMINILTERLKEQPARVRAAVMDGQALTFADGTFDAACSCFGIILFPDHMQGLREMHRVLKSGGRGAIVSWGSMREQPMAPWHNFFTDVRPDLAVELALPAGLASMQTAEGMQRELESAGFSVAVIESVKLPFRWSSASAFMSMAQANPFLRTALDGVGKEREEEILGAFRAWLDAQHGSEPFVVMATALIGIAFKP